MQYKQKEEPISRDPLWFDNPLLDLTLEAIARFMEVLGPLQTMLMSGQQFKWS